MSLACATCPVRDRAACAVLSEAERDDLARRGRHRTLAAGDVLFHAGEKADTCATLTSGALKVTATDAEGNERILALIHPAGFIGEFFQPFDDHEVVALSESQLCMFSGPDIETAMAEHPALARALLRRAQGRGDDRIELGQLTVDLQAHTVTLAGRVLTLPQKEFRLLVYLAERRGRVVPKPQLEQMLYGWDEGAVSNTVEVYVSALRRKIGAASIRTLRGVGYMIP